MVYEASSKQAPKIVCCWSREMDRIYASALNVAETKRSRISFVHFVCAEKLYVFNGHLKWGNINYNILSVFFFIHNRS